MPYNPINSHQYKLVALNSMVLIPPDISKTVNSHHDNAAKLAFTVQVGLLAHNIVTEWNKPADEQDLLKLVTSSMALQGMLLQDQHLQGATAFFRTGMYAVDTLQVVARVLANIASTPFFVLAALTSQTAKLCGFSEWIGKQAAELARGYLSENVIPYLKELLPLLVYTVLPGVTTAGENGVSVHTLLGSERHTYSDTDVFYDPVGDLARRDAVGQGPNVTITGVQGTGFGSRIQFLGDNQLVISAPQGNGAVYILSSNTTVNLADGLPVGATNISSATGMKLGTVISVFDINGDAQPDVIMQGLGGLHYLLGTGSGFPAHVDFDQLPRINGTRAGDGNIQAVGTVDGSAVFMASRANGTVALISGLRGVENSLPADPTSTVVSCLFTYDDKLGVGTRLSHAANGEVRLFSVGQNITLNTTYDGETGARLGAAALSFLGADGKPILVLGATGEESFTGALHVMFQNGSSQVLRGEIPGGLFGSNLMVSRNTLFVTAQNAGIVYQFDIGNGFPANLSAAIKYSGTPQSFGAALATNNGNYVIGDPTSKSVYIIRGAPPETPMPSSSSGANIVAIAAAVGASVGVAAGILIYMKYQQTPPVVQLAPVVSATEDLYERPEDNLNDISGVCNADETYGVGPSESSIYAETSLDASYYKQPNRIDLLSEYDADQGPGGFYPLGAVSMDPPHAKSSSFDPAAPIPFYSVVRKGKTGGIADPALYVKDVSGFYTYPSMDHPEYVSLDMQSIDNQVLYSVNS